MATYTTYNDIDQERIYGIVRNLSRHHDHIKGLDDFYSKMLDETLIKMWNPTFGLDLKEIKRLNTSYFTTLILRIAAANAKGDFQLFIDKIKDAYKEMAGLVKKYHPESEVSIYPDSAHITIKSIVDGFEQKTPELHLYRPTINPIVDECVNMIGAKAILYAVGFIVDLNPRKGLSIGIKFYPTHPIIQIIRGEVGVALYELPLNQIVRDNDGKPLYEERGEQNVKLRPENSFHTRLVHSTGFRARNLWFPLKRKFIIEFKKAVKKYDNVVFGSISEIELSDFYIRSGYSDKLGHPMNEVPV